MFACWSQTGLSVQPNVNLVTNIGAGPDALHFNEGHSTIGIPTSELAECIHPTEMIPNKGADRFTFRKHIVSKKNWFREVRNTLALRTRMKRQWQRLLQLVPGDRRAAPEVQ
jgi:hypothetical protein